jgi:hypothetical protein
MKFHVDIDMELKINEKMSIFVKTKRKHYSVAKNSFYINPMEIDSIKKIFWSSHNQLLLVE